MNMKQDPATKHIGWKINIDAIHQNFYENIAKFPEVSSTFNRYLYDSVPFFCLKLGFF